MAEPEMIKPATAHAVPIITIDGPMGAGRTTLANGLSNTYGFARLSLGTVLLRLADTLRRAQVPLDDVSGVLHHAADMTEPEMLNPHTKIFMKPSPRGHERLLDSFSLLKTPGLFEVLAGKFNELAVNHAGPGIVASGFGMGRTVFADAPLRLFLDAPVADRLDRLRRKYDMGLQLREEVFFADNMTVRKLPADTWQVAPVGSAWKEQPYGLELHASASRQTPKDPSTEQQAEKIDPQAAWLAAIRAYPQVFIQTRGLGENMINEMGKKLVEVYLPEVKTHKVIRKEKTAAAKAARPAAA